ncbi:MAG: TonB-dependent receptor plug domain-containing protein [Calditrichaeota bacterium]|nr:TonB-dependent receptor plug domain-containing protein [Calditrichota bacterium]
MMKKILLAIVSLTLLANVLFAGTTGKIAGKVKDAKSGQALPGVNVIIEGTRMGAATNKDGYYFILNVPPGTYTLKFSMIGYSTYVVKDVRVKIDLTTTENAELEPVVLAGKEVVVVAKRSPVQKDVAASEKNITSAQIQVLPVSSVSDLVGYQAGVTSNMGIRGAGADQTLFMVDGVSLRDERTNEPISLVPLSAVQAVSVQTGGFSAEYNNVRSGVVNLVTKEGSRKQYTGTFTYKVRPPAPKHFGISPYDPKSFWLRPYMDPEVCWNGTENSDWDKYTQRQYPVFEGWNAISERLLKDDDPTNDLTPAALQRLYEWQHRKQGDIKKSDYNIDAGFGGPVPFIGHKLGDLRFYTSYRRERDMYLMELSRDAFINHSLMTKITSDITPSMKLSILGIYGETFATNASRSGGSSYFRTTSGVASIVNRRGFTVPWRIYTDIYYSPTARYYGAFSAKLTQVINPTTFYEVQIEQVHKKYFTSPGALRDTTKKYEIFPGYFVDEAPVGYWPEPSYGIGKQIALGGAVSTSRDYSQITTTSGRADITSQVNENNQVKTGFSVVYDQFRMSFGMVNKFLPEGNTWTKIDRNPIRGNFYIQDKLEYQGFISTLGLVAEFTNPNGNWYNVGPYDRAFFSESYKPSEESKFLTKKMKTRVTVSPRIAISHPITVNSKLYFNYGHYRQIPTSERLYRVQRDLREKLSYIGDPTIPLAKTVAYELGYDQAISNNYLFHLAAYYKDVSDEEFWVRYISFDGKVNYRKITSNAYEDIRGFEADLTKMTGRWFTGNINYEYRVGTSGYFGSARYYENPAEQRQYLRRNPVQYKPRPTPRIKTYLDFHTPMDFGRKILGQRPLAGWNFNIIARWTAGSWFSWNPNNVPGIEYNVQWKSYRNVDLKLQKTIPFKKFDVRFFMDIYNALNIKRFSGYSFYNIHDYNFYMQSLHLPQDIGDKLGYGNIPGNDKPGDFRDDGVDYQPMEWTPSISQVTDPSARAIYYDASTKKYMQYKNDTWVKVDDNRVKEVLDKKAYIDMPNQTFFTFLNPRSIFFGLTVSFHL